MSPSRHGTATAKAAPAAAGTITARGQITGRTQVPLSPANRLQANSALATGSSFDVSLPNPTQDGGTLLLYVGTAGAGSITLGVNNAGFDPPWIQDAAHGGNWYAWRRDSQPAGETSWTITAAISATFAWRVEEWGSLATVGQPDDSGVTILVAGALTAATDHLHAGDCAADVDDFAALAVFRASNVGAAGWPAAHSYGAGESDGPSDWAEADWLVNGDGTHATDFILAIAEAYPGAAGNVACALTFDTSGGGGTPNGMDAWAVCYQPDAPPPAAGVLSS